MIKQGNYMLMTIGQFADYLSTKISNADYAALKEICFEYDFALFDDKEPLDRIVLSTLKLSMNGWYGIKTADCGFNSEDLVVVSDYYGGGVVSARNIFDGEYEISIKDKIEEQIIYTLGNGEGTALNDASEIFVEIKCERFNAGMKDYEAIIESINKQYNEYKVSMCNRSFEDLWENSMRITAYRYLKDYLVDCCGARQDKVLNKLYEELGDNILVALVDEYMEVESCDIASWSDIKDMIINYLQYR